MYAPLGRHAHQFLAEQLHRTGIGGQIAGDEIEQRGLAGAVRADDQPAFARHHLQRDIPGRRQAAETLVQAVDDERGRHSAGSAAGAGVFGLLRFAKRSQSARKPGTSPSGMKMMTAMKVAPSRVFQRST